MRRETGAVSILVKKYVDIAFSTGDATLEGRLAADEGPS